MTSLTSIVALLKTALLLLMLAQGPNVPKSLHDQAVSVANQAIAAATQALVSQPKTISTPVVISPSPAFTPSPSPSPTPSTPTPLPATPPPMVWGWDYDLTKECVKSTSPSSVNYYQDTKDCGTSGNWTVAVQSEKTLGASYPGPANQSFPINTTGSPVSMNWVRHTDEFGKQNYSVNLKTNFDSNVHPGGPGYFTWFVLMDHVNQGGGPLPRPDKLTFNATVDFNDFVPNGATRMIVGWQGFWDGKAHSVEINLASSNWGDAHPDADVVNIVKTNDLEFVNMDGTKMGLGIQRLVDTKIQIDWYQIIQNLISRGLLATPSQGWENTATGAVFIGTETENLATSTAAISDLWVTNFRIETKK